VENGSRDLFFIILGSLHILGTVEAKNFKFSTPMENTIPMTSVGENRNRKYNSIMADVRFHKSKVVIS